MAEGGRSDMNVLPFQADHIGAAAELLAATHRGNTPAPTAVVWDPEIGAQAISNEVGGGPAFAAVEHDKLVGYMVSNLASHPGPSRVRITDLFHATDVSRARTAYRALWEAMAEALTGFGCFEHRITVLAEPSVALQAHFELGFGIDQIKGIRPASAAVSTDTSPLTTEEAAPADLDALVGLSIELSKYHSRPPMLAPVLMNVPASRADLRSSITDQDRVVVVIRRDGRPIAMMQAQPDRRYPHTLTIYQNVVTESLRSTGIGSTMLRDLLAWAAKRAYHYCAVGWTSANLVSDSFYRAHRFQPIRYELVRRIDPRVTWANETLDLSLFDRDGQAGH